MKLEEAIGTDRFDSARHKASLNVLYTAYWFKKHVNEVLKEHGSSHEQFNVLRILRGRHPDPMCMKDIAGRIIEKNSNVPRIVDRLVEKKLVKRTTSKADRRETLVTLNDDGLNFIKTANRALDKKSAAVIGLSETEAEELNRLLEKLRLID